MNRSHIAALAAVLTLGCTAGRVAEDTGADDTNVVRIPDTNPSADSPMVTCMPGMIDCNGVCTRVVGDPANCGSCGNRCPAHVGCAVGRCDCMEPMLSCDGLCIDPKTDHDNCGACGHACGVTEQCSLGECVTQCDEPGHMICVTTNPMTGARTQTCANLQTDPMHCGTCSMRCTNGASCVAGVCECTTGTSCMGTCVDLQTDAQHCGTCYTGCGTDGVCTAGACSTCGGGLSACGSPAHCVNTQTSTLNCGSCGNTCPLGSTCTAGVCTCPSGGTACGTTCVDTSMSTSNCGSCGNVCPIGSACTAGVCSCPGTGTACSGSCVELQTDNRNCGSCGNVCPSTSTCMAGTCVCPGTTTYCMGTGTCSDVMTDPNNCGGCGHSCGVGGVCNAGTCMCGPGYTMCDATSCTNTMFDRMNCGTCGHVCPAATPACVMGACTNAPPTHYTVRAATAAEAPFVDACAAPGHMSVLPTTDDSFVSVTLPFPFRYWATDLAAGSPINVSSNGFLNMDGMASAVYYSMSIPDPMPPAPNSVIALHWGDDYTSSMGICIATVGSAPNRQWVLEWANGGYFGSPGLGLTYEVILNENSGIIDMVFQTMTGARAQLTGLEDPTGMMGISGCPGTPTVYSCTPTSGYRVRYTPTP